MKGRGEKEVCETSQKGIVASRGRKTLSQGFFFLLLSAGSNFSVFLVLDLKKKSSGRLSGEVNVTKTKRSKTRFWLFPLQESGWWYSFDPPLPVICKISKRQCNWEVMYSNRSDDFTQSHTLIWVEVHNLSKLVTANDTVCGIALVTSLCTDIHL